MNPDDVFSLLVDADPWPDLEAADAAVLPRTTSVSEWSTQMRTIEPDVQLTPEEPPTRRPRTQLLAAAAVVVGLAIVVAAFVIRDDADPPVPADEPPPSLPTREERAVATAEAFYAAVAAGDIDTVMAMTDPDFANLEADRAMWEMNAVASASDANFTVTGCTVVDTASAYVEVDCAATADSSTWQAVGITEIIAPLRVFDDQLTDWLPFRGADVGPAVQATAEYLREFRPDDYAAVCEPIGYDPATIVSAGGLALTPECAELFVPLDDDIAQWILDGRPGA